MGKTLLLVDDEDNVLQALQQALTIPMQLT